MSCVAAMAVDPVAGWLFMGGGGWIQRARLDGSQRDLLYNGTQVADIALDVQVCVTRVPQDSCQSTEGTTATETRTFINVPLRGEQTQHVYWAESLAAVLWVARYDGSARAQLARFAAQRHHPVALALYNHTLYWLDT